MVLTGTRIAKQVGGINERKGDVMSLLDTISSAASNFFSGSVDKASVPFLDNLATNPTLSAEGNQLNNATSEVYDKSELIKKISQGYESTTSSPFPETAKETLNNLDAKTLQVIADSNPNDRVRTVDAIATLSAADDDRTAQTNSDKATDDASNQNDGSSSTEKIVSAIASLVSIVGSAFGLNVSSETLQNFATTITSIIDGTIGQTSSNGTTSANNATAQESTSDQSSATQFDTSNFTKQQRDAWTVISASIDSLNLTSDEKLTLKTYTFEKIPELYPAQESGPSQTIPSGANSENVV
ncbi:MAG: hypothetical protein ACRCWJ_17360 [Casimicrobium sp.]